MDEDIDFDRRSRNIIIIGSTAVFIWAIIVAAVKHFLSSH